MQIRYVIILLLFLVLAFQATAQKAVPLKFDEFIDVSNDSYFFDDELSFKERYIRLAERMKIERGRKVFIVYYRARISNYRPYARVENLAGRAKWEVVQTAKLDADSVTVVDGGLRENDTLEFWIGQKNSELPPLTPTFASEELIECPNIDLYFQGPRFDDKTPAVVTLNISPSGDLEPAWSVKGGKIVGGNSYAVDIEPDPGQRVTVIVVLGKVHPPCANSAILTQGVSPGPFLVDEFEKFLFSDFSGRLDVFMAEISREPEYRGVIILYGARKLGSLSLQAAKRLTSNQINFRRFPKDRIQIIEGGFREYSSVEMWLTKDGMKAPVPMPTVDSSFVRPPKKKQSRRR